MSPGGTVGLGQPWMEPIGLIGSHRESWKGRAGGRHSPDPVREVKNTGEARKGQQKVHEEQGRVW